MQVLKLSLESGNKARISSFFQTNVSPSVIEYKRRQRAIVDKVISNEASNDHLNESEHFRMVNNALDGSLHFRRKGQPTCREDIMKKLKRIKSIGRVFRPRSA